MQYNKMCLICYVNAYHYKLNVNADKCNKDNLTPQLKRIRNNFPLCTVAAGSQEIIEP